MIRELGNGRAGTRKRDYVAAMGPAMSCGYDTSGAEKRGVRMVQALESSWARYVRISYDTRKLTTHDIHYILHIYLSR